jgi:hypothetical protein
VRQETRDPSARLYATDGTADWLLWRIPDLRGRLAYDVRFELYDQATLDEIVQYGRLSPGWSDVVGGYGVVVVDDLEHLRAIRSDPAVRASYRDTSIVVLVRAD